ncbi:hypothetical protein ACIRPX_26720 [Streptomyces sp. NPDC101225]|uniref:hypothetical protein n=1 Tax=Streptomyces sp. NPDC101225 TaxID=3366135 RepID=UPI0037FE4B60
MTSELRIVAARNEAKQGEAEESAVAGAADAPVYVQDGQTKNVTYYYDDRLGDTGKALAEALKATSEADYARLVNLFGVTLPDNMGQTPLYLYVIPGDGGAHHAACRNPQLYLSAYQGDNPDLVRFLAVAESSEVFMAVQDAGWNCAWSNGEALSRALATEFYPAQLNPPGVAYGFKTAHYWLDGARPDYVTRNAETDTDNISLGCAVLFINYLRFQLGYDLERIIRAGGATLADTYRTLTGRTDAFAAFKQLMDRWFPPGTPCGLNTDNPFPLGRFESIGGTFAYPPAVLPTGATTASDTVEVYAVDTARQLCRNTWNSGWRGWEKIGGTLVGSPTVISRAPGTTDVFGVGTDGEVYHLSQAAGGWGAWESLGAAAFSDITAVSSGPDSMDILFLGQDSTIWHRSWKGGRWADWDRSKGPILSRPSAVVWNGGLQIVATGPNSDLMHLVYREGDGFFTSESLGDALSSPPVIVAPDSERLNVFFRGTDLTLHHRFWFNGWGGVSSSLGGVLLSPPHATVLTPTRIAVTAAYGPDHSVRHCSVTLDGTAWSGSWADDGGTVASPPLPLGVLPGRLDEYVLGLDHAVWHQRL